MDSEMAGQEDLRRLMVPAPTRTWLKGVCLPEGQTWNEHTPPSICRESPATRLIAVRYDDRSCTFEATSHPRWGIESLRIPDFAQPPFDPIRVGDCLLTIGGKFDPSQDEPNSPYEVRLVRIWFPQRVVHVEPEGPGQLRAWVVWDADVSDMNAALDDLDMPSPLPTDEPRILTQSEAAAVWQAFQLDVFCLECGNRAAPIVYGMPGPNEPRYLVLGGCIIEPDQPRYACICGHQWSGTEDT